MSWTAAALCAQVDPVIFFPEKGGSLRDARLICSLCDVRPECLADALASGEQYGVRGGKTQGQRAALARATRKVEAS